MEQEIERLKIENAGLKIENDFLWKMLEMLGECVAKLDDVFVNVEITKAKLKALRQNLPR